MPEITSAPTSGATCPEQRAEAASPPLFPPRDADAAAYRRWLAESPWPEVVFASAGAR
ncbi:hypothetical protein [uncultured Phycicoccus sp.]|uniref:hypothetical protein n=1 Tax=uncultured Phycicoccus sp. TaxID=661422 RepID=UPI002611A3AE|nr:hypothetical protein [uncultured Phycicoccus sp.]